MAVIVFVLISSFCFNTARAFLFQPSQQTTPNIQNLEFLMKSLLSLSNNEAIVDSICRAYPSLIIPHPHECQLYYNCSGSSMYTTSNYVSHYMMECNYPDLFSEKTHQCENFTEVCCGARREIKDRCSYRRDASIGRYFCKYPSCVGDPDGFVRIYDNSKQVNYKICFKERLIREGSCKLWFELPYHGKCTSRLEIPISEGGHLPSCSGMSDGIYRFDLPSGQYIEREIPTMGITKMEYGDYFGLGRVCDVYYICSQGNITVVKCKNGTVFHSNVGACRPGNSSIASNCQVYCNPEKNDVNPLPLNVAECPYPLQFSETTKRCENFTKVICGTRSEETYFCNYLNEQYRRRFSYRCLFAQTDKCTVSPDGLFRYPTGPDEYFIRCYRKRLVEQGKCPIDLVWGTQTYPYNGTCTQRFAIPDSVASYGRLPNCTEKSDGNYKFSTRPCDAYYRCDGGRATAVKCPDHTYFDATHRRCSTNVACYRA